MLQDITKLVSLILGISVASDRLITIIKSIWPSLAAPAGSAAEGPKNNLEVFKKVFLIVISFLCCFATSELLSHNGVTFPVAAGALGSVPLWAIALMATGGSAFWTNLLGYFSALKDVTNLKALASKTQIDAAAEHSFSASQDKRVRAKAAKTVRFAAAFSGGAGTLAVKIVQTGDSFVFAADGTKDLQLPEGEIDFTLSGAAAPGPGGGVVLTITGARASNSPIKFGPGLIQAQEQAMLV